MGCTKPIGVINAKWGVIKQSKERHLEVFEFWQLTGTHSIKKVDQIVGIR